MNIWDLRASCSGHRRPTVQAAVNAALGNEAHEDREVDELASLVTSWLLDEQPSDDPPPLMHQELIRIAAALNRQTH